VAQTWRVLQGRRPHPRNERCRTEWWILWRRIAGGLEPGQQKMLAEPLMAALRARWSALAAQQSGRRLARAGKASGGEFRFGSNEYAEVWRLLGSLELLDVGLKIALGQLVFDLGLRKGPEAVREASAWALGRLGLASQCMDRSTRWYQWKSSKPGHSGCWRSMLIRLRAPGWRAAAVGHLCRGATDTSDRRPLS